ncbi:hypothetical protein ACVWZA_002359 [Sphingomonas sp. UYAg733]
MKGSNCLSDFIARFPPRLPPNEPFVTLSHAISWIVYRHSMPARNLSAIVGIGEAKHISNPIWNAQLDDFLLLAVKRLTDAGTVGSVEIRGRYFRNVLDDENQILTQLIPPVRLADYRWFDTLDDSLHRGLGLAWGPNRREPDYNYPAHDNAHYRFVTVNRANLMREFPNDVAKSQIKLDRFTVAEIDGWIRATSLTGMKVARTDFMKNSRAKGLSGLFENRWNHIKKNKPGRPKIR